MANSKKSSIPWILRPKSAEALVHPRPDALPQVSTKFTVHTNYNVAGVDDDVPIVLFICENIRAVTW
jgi:hypothetical protein